VVPLPKVRNSSCLPCVWVEYGPAVHVRSPEVEPGTPGNRAVGNLWIESGSPTACPKHGTYWIPNVYL